MDCIWLVNLFKVRIRWGATQGEGRKSCAPCVRRCARHFPRLLGSHLHLARWVLLSSIFIGEERGLRDLLLSSTIAIFSPKEVWIRISCGNIFSLKLFCAKLHMLLFSPCFKGGTAWCFFFFSVCDIFIFRESDRSLGKPRECWICIFCWF